MVGCAGKAGDPRGILLRSKFIALALVACGGLVLAAGASALVSSYPTRVTIKEQNGDFHGKVKTDPGGEIYCLADRKVTLFKKKRGPDQKINSDTTGKDGRWDTGNTHVGHGKYYAKAKAVPQSMKRGELPLCKKGKSPTVTVN
jgi:hypothetical protein